MENDGRRRLFKDINKLIQDISENLATVESLIKFAQRPMLSGNDDEITSRMHDTAGSLKKLLPLVQCILIVSEPIDEELKEVWWMEREKINREFENMLSNFQRTHSVWHEADLPPLPMDTLEQLFFYEQELCTKMHEIRRESAPPQRTSIEWNEGDEDPPTSSTSILDLHHPHKKLNRRHTSDSTTTHTVPVAKEKHSAEKKPRKECVVS